MRYNITASEAMATLVVGLGGWFLAVATVLINYRQKQEETFQRALDWMTEKTQRRNVGIAAIEGSWNRRRFRRLSTPVLCGSAIYLLLYSGREDAPHELYNLERIMRLLIKNKSASRYRFQYSEVLTAIKHKIHDAERKVEGKGLAVPSGTLQDWRQGIELKMRSRYRRLLTRD